MNTAPEAPTEAPAEAPAEAPTEAPTEVPAEAPADAALAVARLEETVAQLRGRLADQERRFRLLDTQVHVLERERQKLAAMVNHADAGFVVFDTGQRVVWTNRYFVQGFGHDVHPGSFLRSTCQQSLCGQEAPCASCPVATALACGRVAHHEIDLPVDGEVRNVYLSAMPIRTMTGEVAEVMVMLQDLSDLQILRRAAAVAAAAARAAAAHRT
jgi:PAS domain-containing protein